MHKPFRTAAVLGAGVMGAQIAAHLANAGLTVHLLDLPGKSEHPNDLVEAAFQKAKTMSPPIFYSQQAMQRVILGNYAQHFQRLAQVDWVIEAVVENLTVKQELMARLEKTVAADAVISTNTSGLSIRAIARGRSQSFRRRFLGTHFFNPPRYLKLLELIPTADTEPQLVERLAKFSRLRLGKGIVVAKDTPNFIANRIGVFVSMLGIRAFTEGDYTIEEIDTLTGTLVGRPKSATFRTADLVGLDTLLYVADNLYAAIPQDERRQWFQMPELCRQLVETGSLGAKSGQGFYKKVAGEIRSLNPDTFGYEAPRPMRLGNLDTIEQQPDLGDRLRSLYRHRSRAGDFCRHLTLETLAYSANRIPEITDDPRAIDQALCWGFGWQLGPFQIWDALGFDLVIEDMRMAGLSLPAWIETMQTRGATGFYGPGPSVYRPGEGYVAWQKPVDELHLAEMTAASQATLWHNREAALLDLGDGVALLEFRSKANTLSTQVIEGLEMALTWLASHDDYHGLVIGNEGPNFCVGINLAEVGKIAQWDNLNPFSRTTVRIAQLLSRFQTLMQQIHYFPKPIVAAIQGGVLGGGCELAMACPQVVAAAETYMGLVELGGPDPGRGRPNGPARWAANRAITQHASDILPWLQQAFKTVGMATVATSAYEAQALGFLNPQAQVVINSDRRLYVAKQAVLCLHHRGYAHRRGSRFRCWATGPTTLEHMAYVMYEGGYIK
ncbi:3-hydroxyacyl-CoA dehydrogenase [Halomicronema hongdechloris C2206]|uniref:3-hydroxyacyl-CoA dehydrogenase n=1 Tax=Halomicronema hongdechloris C2206 TaxID=1641165 RepID=A0A1Z3HJJ9_9CYAN|nr:3-hydroxyacyl-CoA dehydrogenase/enoyl-CoA hydratase family protein [Halomicronema hongdechloris]ASC70489.1 3-hydroxyacyl-CoA dehydrogenase [Halomicronema hongdechloris C2206]